MPCIPFRMAWHRIVSRRDAFVSWPVQGRVRIQSQRHHGSREESQRARPRRRLGAQSSGSRSSLDAGAHVRKQAGR